MKKNIAIIIASLLFTIALFAQETLTIKEEKLPMSKGTENAFTVNIPQTRTSDVSKDWGRYIRRNSRGGKRGSSKGEFYALEGIIERISPQSMNIYTLFTQTTSGVKMSVFFLQNDAFVTSENQLFFKGAKAFIHEFAKQSYKDAVEEELKAEQDVLKNLQKDLDKIYKDKDKETNNINRQKQEIAKLENEIATKKSEQQIKDKEITEQRKKMIGVALNADEKKLQDKLVSSLEKEKRSLIKDEQKRRNNINKADNSIKKSEREISGLESKLNLQLQKVQQQKERVHKVETKLKDIQRM